MGELREAYSNLLHERLFFMLLIIFLLCKVYLDYNVTNRHGSVGTTSGILLYEKFLSHGLYSPQLRLFLPNAPCAIISEPHAARLNTLLLLEDIDVNLRW